MAESLALQLDRLTTKIASGDVVFFIGAGFSLESEFNTADVLITRLLAQFDAITAVALKPPVANQALARLCAELHEGIKATFRLTAKDGSICHDDVLSKNVRRLQDTYYPINDWMCSAFESILVHWRTLDTLCEPIAAQANDTVRRYVEAMRKDSWRVNAWPVPVMNFRDYHALLRAPRRASSDRIAAGKAFFLDTMGFADGGSMVGDPRAGTPDDVIRSYAGRLRDRHAVLAWLALEGALPVLLTTNYDVLLEGAYRLAGMEYLGEPASPGTNGERGPAGPVSTHPEPTAREGWPRFSRRLRHYTPIAGAPQFFRYGDGYQSALILKIHGCVSEYRDARRHKALVDRVRAWRAVLPTMVFTFREIQNWRDDSWSRDLVKTLLRTRTVVFAGYSGQDPVLHDTFRSVYEEMSMYRPPNATRVRPDTGAGPVSGSAASAFFLDLSPKREFHGLEILRSASNAAGDASTGLTTHPNLINFFGIGSSFPNVDELMLLMFHFTYRKLQLQALESELRRVAYQLVGRPRSEQESTQIIDEFRALCRWERDQASQFHTAPAGAPGNPDVVARTRRRFRRMIGWTVDFHRQLLREFTAADLLLRKPERASRVYAAMRWPWYSPLNEHPDWAAWAVVVELAIRARAAQWSGVAGGSYAMRDATAEALAADRPAVLIRSRPGDQRPVPRIALTIEVTELRRQISTPSGALFRFQSPVQWSLRNHTVPWWLASDSQRPVLTPGPETLWGWVARPAADAATPSSADPRTFFSQPLKPSAVAGGQRR